MSVGTLSVGTNGVHVVAVPVSTTVEFRARGSDFFEIRNFTKFFSLHHFVVETVHRMCLKLEKI